MPIEDRRIVFSSEEVYKALYALSVKKDMPPPPPGVVRMVSENTKNPAEIIVKLEDPSRHKAEAVEYSRDFLAASLLMFCRGAGIPLPKSGQKSVMINDGEVILRVQKKI
ncbi:MAG: hypothetical protein JKY71_06700 [Alphaproteobacteria bacterium]|nr:hypothetical protein [Alphaproteobacteria bacterium]